MANLEAKGFGAALRTAREAAGRDIRDLADTTRIQGRYLEALEAEDWSGVPKGVIGRGFVRVVARELGVPAPELLQLYLAARGEDDAEPERSLPEVDWKVDVGAGRKGRPMALAGAAVVAAAAALWLWGPWGHRAPPAPAPKQPAAPAAVAVPYVPAAPAPPATVQEPPAGPPAALPKPVGPVAPAPKPTLSVPQAPAVARTGSGRLEIEANERVWVRVEPEGGQAQERVLKPGERAVFGGSRRFRVKVSNGAAAKLFWNGEALGVAGTSTGVASVSVPPDPVPPDRVKAGP